MQSLLIFISYNMLLQASDFGKSQKFKSCIWASWFRLKGWDQTFGLGQMLERC